MKRIWIYLLLLFSTSSFGQNLVPNPSFEIFDTCAYTLGQVQFATGWNNYGKTPDYFNSCATSASGVSVPSNFTGYQQAENGNAYCGMQFINYADTTYREYIGATLSSPLQVGQKYYVSAYFSLADINSLSIAINKLCIKFSTVAYSQNSPPILDNFAQVVSDSIITDTVGWYQLKGSFIADSTYSQIIIGNFFNDYHTDTLLLFHNTESIAYYMIDMVCVSSDSNTCYSSSTGMHAINQGNSEININYVNDNIILTNPFSHSIEIKVSITDVLGRNLFAKQVYLNETDKIPVKFLRASIYFVTIQTKNNIQTIKFIKK